MTHFYKDMIPMRDPQYGWALEFPFSHVWGMNGPRNGLILRNCLANNFDINLLISNSHNTSIYTLSMVIVDTNVWSRRYNIFYPCAEQMAHLCISLSMGLAPGVNIRKLDAKAA